MHSLSCFAKMLKPTSYFTDAGLSKMGAAAQIASRGRWALAHMNQNLRVIHEVSFAFNILLNDYIVVFELHHCWSNSMAR